MEHTLTCIGIVHSVLRSLADCPLQEYEKAPEAELEIFPPFLVGMRDVKPGDDIILFTWLHKANRSTLETHPRNDSNIPLKGIFSTRSPDRPNPIGLHLATVLAVEGNKWRVSSLEVLDQTPILDIKPRF